MTLLRMVFPASCGVEEVETLVPPSRFVLTVPPSAVSVDS